MAGFFRPLKYALQGHDIYRLLIHEATENDDNQPTQSDLEMIVKRSRDFSAAPWVMAEVLEDRLEDRPKKWRRTLKAMKVTEYCIREGPKDFLEWAYTCLEQLKRLRRLEYVTRDGTEVAGEVRATAKEMVPWVLAEYRALRDRIAHEGLEEELRKEDARQERLRQAARLREERSGVGIVSLDGAEPPSYSKVVALDRELQAEEARQERLRRAMQLRQEKEGSSSGVEPGGSSGHADSIEASRGNKPPNDAGN
ncbi:hypothetical protein N7492_009435 [Penicillium capsulatum]|uniref:ENTH domain-containing protein n=1 Tax=Penicillium capsulatum TaxID=69766 RepID=A0A9W9HSU8_9EURO|nr:hypothetical protein N7492_009435 [Penicillium capsulatum]KAJ6106825.1 hypothetical protein N7512_010342 [Penicillium capsulatum]